jgi:hypothetical protein
MTVRDRLAQLVPYPPAVSVVQIYWDVPVIFKK